jgi:hypothetical protein
MPPEPSPQKLQMLIAFYQTCWAEMSWRRNAGYRTIIIGLGYFGAMVAVAAFNPSMPLAVRSLLAGVIVVGTLFGAGYLTSNYRKYMAASAMTVKIEQHVGAYDASFLGDLGPLFPPDRAARPQVPLSRDVVCLWSVIAFLLGGLLTAAAMFAV